MAARFDLTDDVEILEWLLLARRGTAYFARKLNELDDAALAQPSLLPGWSRRHLVAHVGYNARGLARLVDWARTGVENPMYPSIAAREREIELGATLSANALRNLAEHAAIHLNVEWRDLPAARWQAEVRTVQGRSIPISETVWMRIREVWIHAVDLNNGARFSDIPESILLRLKAEILAAWDSRGEQFSIPDGELAEQVQWMSGRAAQSQGLAIPPRWL